MGYQHFNVANLAGCRRSASELLHISKRHAVYIRAGHQYHGHHGYHHSRAKEQPDLSLPRKGGQEVGNAVNAKEEGRKIMSRTQIDIDGKDDGGNTQLMRAALDGDTAALEGLILNGADVNAQNHEGRTALMFAIINLRLDSVKALLNFGADVNVQAVCGCTPLMLAAVGGDSRITQALLNNGADANRICQPGKTALVVAIEHGYQGIVELLRRGMGQTTQLKPERPPVTIRTRERSTAASATN